MPADAAGGVPGLHRVEQVLCSELCEVLGG